MKALKWPLLAALGWIAAVAAIGMLHTEVVMKGTLSAAEDERISERYGQLAGMGAVGAGVVTYLLRRDRDA
jgi:hypothetical protein